MPLWRRAPRRFAGVVVLTTTIGLAGWAVPSRAGAQTESAPEATPTTTSTTEPPATRVPREAVEAAIRMGQTTAELVKVQGQIDEVQAREDALADELADLDRQLEANLASLEVLRARVQDRAAAAYVKSGNGSLSPLQIERPLDIQAGSRYASAANAVDDNLVGKLMDLRAELEANRARKAEARDELARSVQDLIASRNRLETLRLEEQMLVDTWGVVTIMGPSQLTAEQIVAFYESTGITPKLPAGLTMADVARLFVEEGALAGVRGDIAFAQSMIETGSFTEFKGNNFSGIGVCDSCTGGYLFDAARDGVRAQMQLLRSYADPTSRASDFTVPLSPVLYSTDPVEGARRFDTFFKKGVAPVWNDMGDGNWPTDPFYAGKVLKMYSRMLAHAHLTQ